MGAGYRPIRSSSIRPSLGIVSALGAPMSVYPRARISFKPTQRSTRATLAAHWSARGELMGINTYVFSQSGEQGNRLRRAKQSRAESRQRSYAVRRSAAWLDWMRWKSVHCRRSPQSSWAWEMPGVCSMQAMRPRCSGLRGRAAARRRDRRVQWHGHHRRRAVVTPHSGRTHRQHGNGGRHPGRTPAQPRIPIQPAAARIESVS